MEVVRTASDGREALQQIDQLRPDVVTLDLQMPDLDEVSGDAGRPVRGQDAVAVIVVSSLTQFGATITLEALDHGALGCLPKPQGTADLRAL